MEERMKESFRSDVQPEPMQLDPEKFPPAIRPHIPGQHFVMSDGTQYEVRPNGSWKKIVEGMSYKKRKKLGLE